MIDIHNHILPAVDDGAKDLDISRDMLRVAASQGVEHIVLTPHLYEPDIIKGTGEWKNRILTAYEDLRQLVEREQINVQLTQAAEVRFQGMLEVILEELPVLLGGKYLLLEFSFSNVPLHVENAIYELFRKGITPILAHPERIKPWQREPERLAELINMGCLSQLDIGSFLGRLGPSAEAFAHSLLEAGAVQLVGSDSHNLNSRPLFAKEGYLWLTEHYGSEIADLYLKENPARILAGDYVEVYPVDLTPPKKGLLEKIVSVFK